MFKIGDRVSIAMNAPIFYRSEFGKEGIVLNCVKEYCIKVQLLAPARYSIIYIQGIYLNYSVRARQLEFTFMLN